MTYTIEEIKHWLEGMEILDGDGRHSDWLSVKYAIDTIDDPEDGLAACVRRRSEGVPRKGNGKP